MASETIRGNERFPVGTSVSVYPAQNRHDGQAPVGSAVTSATVASDSTLTFTGLTDGAFYVAYALVNGEHRYVGFAASAPPSSAGSSGVNAAAEGALPGLPDCTAAMRAAYSKAVSLNVPLRIPPGTYNVDTTAGDLFPIGTTKVVIAGDGSGDFTGSASSGTRIYRTAGASPLVSITGTADTGAARGHGALTGIEFNGGGGAGDVAVFARANEILCSDVRFANATGRLLHATQLWNSRFANCFFYAGGNGTTAPAVLLDGIAGDGTQGACQTVQFLGCEWEANTGTDLRVTGSKADTNPSYGITLTNVKFERQIAGVAYPVLDLDYVYRFTCAGFDISAGGAGTTSPLVQTPSDGYNNVAGGICFSGGFFNHTGSPTYYLDLQTGYFEVDATFLGAPATSYVRLASTVSNAGWRHSPTTRFQDPTKGFTDQRANVATPDICTRRVPIDHSNGTDVALGWVRAWELADAATQKVCGVLRVPENYLPGATITMRVSWTSATTSGNVRFQVDHSNIAASTNLGAASPTTILATDAAPGTANGVKFTDFSIGTPYNQNGLMPWSVSRLGADAADTLADTVRIVSVELLYRKVGG